MSRSLNDVQLNRLEQSPSSLSQDHTRVETTPSPHVTAATLDDVKNSIQELASILLRARGGAFDEAADEFDTDRRGRYPRRSREILNEQNDDMGSVGSITPPPPPTMSVPPAPTAHRRSGRQFVRIQSPRPGSGSIMQIPSSRSSSIDRSRAYITQPAIGVQPLPAYRNTGGTVYYPDPSYGTYATGRELDSVISDFSTIVIIATFLASVSIVMLQLARNIYDGPNLPKSNLNKTFNTVLQVFASLALSFNLSVAIVAGGAASSQSLRLRLGQRASDFSRSQSLDTKLQLCSTMQYYGLLCLTIATACIFALLLNSPYSVLMIIPVVGVVFYDSLFRGKVSSAPPYYGY